MEEKKKGELIVLSNDRAADEDAFGLEDYIKGLSDFIGDCATPMTVAIQGSWGSGKTSMMKMIAKRLEGRAVCVEFNTWQYSQFNLGDKLPIIFYESLIEKIATGDGKWDQEKKDLMELCKKTARTVVKLGASLAGLDDTLDIVTEGMAKDKNDSLVKTVEDLCSNFRKLVEKRLKGTKEDRVVFFVDDLDRLSPERAVELMEVLKIVMECEECVFVLAIDYDVVLRGVRAKYGQDFAESKGRSFFDKIIQVPVTLPVAQYQMNNYIRGLLDSITGGMGQELFTSEEELGYAVSFVELAIGHNPRSVKRLFNAYTLSLYMLRGQNVPLMTKELLFAVQCLQLGFESVYHYLRQVVGDSDDLHTFLTWFKDDDEATLDSALARDPVLAEKLDLGEYSPLRRSELRQFIRRFIEFTGAAEYIQIMNPERKLFGPEFNWLTDGTISAIQSPRLAFYQWETLQDALELSAATALGAHPGRKLSRVPFKDRFFVMDSLIVNFNIILSNEENLRQPAGDICYMARKMTVEGQAGRGRYFRESAVMALYMGEGGWHSDEDFYADLTKARKNPEPFAKKLCDRIWAGVEILSEDEKKNQREHLTQLVRSDPEEESPADET